MSLFSYKRSLALCWDDTDSLLAVCVERAGRGWRIVDRVRGDGGVLETQLRAAITTLGRSSETIVVVGGNPADASVCDVVMPNLSAADLASALRLELPRFTPLSPDRLRFGYRIVGRNADTGALTVRLVFAPTEKWERWLAAASTITGGVDAMLPAAAALDPALADRAVSTGAPEDGLCQVASPAADGAREWVLSHADDCDGVFGLGEQPLAMAGLELGPLAVDSVEDQQAFAPAVILAIYALESRVGTDARSLPPLPTEMRPRRYGILKAVAVLAALYIVGTLALVGGKRLQVSRQAADTRRQAYATLVDRQETLQRNTVDPAAARELLDELNDRLAARAVPSLALSAINAGVDDRMWCQNFLWSDGGKLMVTMVAKSEGEGMTDGLKASPLITDFGEERRVRPDKTVAYQISFTMRPLSEIVDVPAPAMQWTPVVVDETPAKPAVHGVPAVEPAIPAPTRVEPPSTADRPADGGTPEPPVVPPETVGAATEVPPAVWAAEPEPTPVPVPEQAAPPPATAVPRPPVVRPTQPGAEPPPPTAPGIVRPALEE